MLALAVLIVVARRVSCLDRLGILGRIRECQQLLLQFGRNVNRGKMSTLPSYTHLRVHIIVEEDALIVLLSVSILIYIVRNPTGVAGRSIYGKSTIYISPSLVKLNSLPCILGRLTYAWSISNNLLIIVVCIVCVLILANCLDTSLNLGFSKSQRQI